jgi:hypothetical protein
MEPIDRKESARRIYADLKGEIERLKAEHAREIADLEIQLNAARILVEAKCYPAKPNGKAAPATAQIIRAKNVSHLAFQYLRDNCPAGATVPNLHKLLTDTGASVGSSNYLYKIMSDLVKIGLAKKIEGGKFIATPSQPEIDTDEWKAREVTH